MKWIYGVILLSLLTSRSAALAPEDPALKAPPEWRASGAGHAEEGRYRWSGDDRKGVYTVSLQRPAEAEYLITGAAVLPNGASLQLETRAGASEPEAEGSVLIARDSKGVRLKMNRAKVDGPPVNEPIPVRIAVLKSGIEIAIGGLEHFIPRALAGEEMQLSLRGKGAELSGLNVLPLKTGGNHPVLAMGDKVNETDAAVGLASRSIPRGWVRSKGVLFHVPEKGVVDIAPSMRGAEEPLNNKKAFYMAESLGQRGRVVFKVPGDAYRALHLLAFSAGRPEHVPNVTARIGFYGNGSAILEDTVVKVPLLQKGEKTPEVVASAPVKLANGREGWVHHLRIPMEKSANFREFDTLDLEFTREMNTHVMPPDPNLFGKIPAGLPSDVVLLGATLEPSPLMLRYETREPGNVFHEDQKAEFVVTVKNRSPKERTARIVAEARGPGTGEEGGVEVGQWTREAEVTLAPGEEKSVKLDLTPGKRGWFSCTIGVETEGAVVQRRDTTFAILAPDTRKAGEESPFGVWEFWKAHSIRPLPDQVDRLASLIHKGGWRHTYGGIPALGPLEPAQLEAEYARLRERYKINFTVQNLPNSYQRKEGWWDAQEFQNTVVPAIEKGLKTSDGYFKVLHESRSSLHLLRRLSEYLGGAPYEMPKAEETVLEKQMENVRQYAAAVKAADPKAKVVLFNDYPAFVNQYLMRKFPAESFDVIGLEGAMFLRSPERQPDWLCLLGHHQEMKRAMQKYGYDKPIWTTEALYHPSQAGALTLHEQATIYVREAAMALQLGIERMAAAGVVKDPSSDYHWSNWGSAGFCYRDPEINPKPSYAAYAWLTQVLDQAKPNGHVKTPNHSLHVVDFKREDGAHVYMIWTANGVQKVVLEYAGGDPEIRDFYGNRVKNVGAEIEATPTPLYILGTTVKAVRSALPVETAAAKADTRLLDFDQPEAVRQVSAGNPVLESSWDTPSFKGDMEAQFVTEDGASALRVELKPDDDPRKLLPRYTEFALAKPIRLEGRPSELVFRVKGNSGWARIMFELVDAKGRVWTSTGNQYAGSSNAADPKGFSFVNFEGWRTMRFPLMGMYPGADQTLYWPDNYNWWASPAPELAEIPRQEAQAKEQFAADLKQYEGELKTYREALAAHEALTADATGGRKPKFTLKEPAKPKLRSIAYRGLVPVDYPLTLTKVIVSMRPHILYLTDEVKVPNPVIYLDHLGVSEATEGM